MKKYCRHNSSCRKEFLFKHFDWNSCDVIDNDYACCDICDLEMHHCVKYLSCVHVSLNHT